MLTLLRIATSRSELRADGGKLCVPAAPKSLCRLATGRSALSHMIGRLPAGHARTVVLPCYVAEGVIQPFLHAEFEVRFYRLNRDLTPMVDDVAAVLERLPAGPVVVLIHYFGFPIHSDVLRTVLSRHSAIVVDDFAHAPFTATPSGEAIASAAQLAIFSLNKFLPVTDGAILLSNRQDVDVTLRDEPQAELPPEVQQAYQDHLQSGRELFESADPAVATRSLHALQAAYDVYYRGINSDLRPYRQSAPSRAVEDAFPLRWLAERRRENSRLLYDGLRNPAFSLVRPTLPANVVPFCIPARVAGLRRPEILETLFARGVMLSTLQDRWNFVPEGERSRYQVETAFLDEHVLIPVSEFIDMDAMGGLIEKLNDI